MHVQKVISRARDNLECHKRTCLLPLGLLVVGIGLSTWREEGIETGEGSLSASVIFHM